MMRRVMTLVEIRAALWPAYLCYRTVSCHWWPPCCLVGWGTGFLCMSINASPTRTESETLKSVLDQLYHSHLPALSLTHTPRVHAPQGTLLVNNYFAKSGACVAAADTTVSHPLRPLSAASGTGRRFTWSWMSSCTWSGLS